MRGAWEALIKSLKKSLKAITRDHLFTKESHRIFIFELESLINNGPITPSSDDINNYKARIPSHILLGQSSSNYPPGIFQGDEINY